MPVNNTFKHYDLDAPDKETLSISSFRGVDFRPAQLSADNDHAVDIKNIIWKDYVNQKRNGYEDCASVPDVTYRVEEDIDTQRTNTAKNINGVYTFIGEDNKQYTLVHAGVNLFILKNFTKEYKFYEAEWELVGKYVTHDDMPTFISYELNNAISCGFVSSNRLYLLDGHKYSVIRAINGVVSVENVEDNNLTYVPVTTVARGVSWKEKKSENEALKIVTNAGSALDDVNMLTQWRKNKFISGLYQESDFVVKDTPFYDYELDTNIAPKDKYDINNILIEINTVEGN